MKKFLAMLVIPFALTACSGASEDAPVATQTVTETAPAPFTPSPTPTPEPEPSQVPTLTDSEFAEAITEDLPQLEGVTDKAIADTARSVCTYLDNTPDLMKAVTIVQGNDGLFTTNDASYFVGASIGAFCPEHATLIDELTSEESESV